jgi:hypothetical protein
MNTQYTYPQKPNLVNVIAWMTLASGVVNIIWGLAASGMALATIVGIICTPITILPSILGIFEILYASKLLSNPPQPVRPNTTIAILEIVCVLTGNVFAMVVGILALVFYNDQVVKDYFARLNGTLPPEPVVPVVPMPPVSPVTPAPVEPPLSSPSVVEERTVIDEEPIPSPLTGETPAAPPSAPDESIITSVRRDGAPDTEPEPPSASEGPDETDPARKAPEE